MLKCLFLLNVLSLVLAQQVHADECDGILKQSIYTSSSEFRSDWRLLNSLTRDDFKRKSETAHANAVISGVPIGISFDSFRDNLSRYHSIYQESLDISQLENIFWTGIDDNTRLAYEACIDSRSFGLKMFPRAATSSLVEIVIRYRSPDPQSAALRLNWAGDITGLKLPTEIMPGNEMTFTVPRPYKGDEDIIISVSAGATSQGMTITSVPKVLSLPAFKHRKVQLRNGTEMLSSAIKMSEINYRHIGNPATSPHTHEFQFVVTANGNSERYSLTVDQSRPWQDQLRIFDIGTEYLEITFSSYNDGVGDLIFRLHPKL